MTAKEFLSQAWRIDMRINSKLEQVRPLRELATKATSTISDMPRAATPNVHRMEDVIVKIMDFESDINADIERLVDTKRKISEALARMTITEYRTLLELRYICCKTWEEIAAEMYYSVRNVHELTSVMLSKLVRRVTVGQSSQNPVTGEKQQQICVEFAVG